MDKKQHSGKGAGANGGNRNKSNTADKLAETTSSFKNLQLGSAQQQQQQQPQQQKGVNSSKNTKKSKKSSSNGSSASTSSAAPSKKTSGPILLGMPDSPMERQDDTDPYTTKIGGAPLWLDQDVPAPSKYGVCEACGKAMFLLLQAYVPLEKSPYDRVVYVWACNQRLCMRKKGSFRVVRALKLNAEYAQKLERKPKPATATPAPTPAAGGAINPFASTGAFDMGNALFGGAGGGFNNPFAPPLATTNPFAPPPGFGIGSPAPAPSTKSFASVTSTNVAQVEESSDSDEEEVPEEPTTWPEKLPSFDPHYLYISEEVLEDASIDDDISQRYSHFLALEEGANNDSDDENANGTAASWSGEAYEKAALPKGVDKAFQKFTERVQVWPDQCVRYSFPGLPLLFSFSDPTAKTLLPPNASQHSKHTSPSAHRIPRCPGCKGPRAFEFQLMPNLLALLDVSSRKYFSEEEVKAVAERKGAQMFDIGMEWGTVLVYSCAEDCFGRKAAAAAAAATESEGGNRNDKVRYFEEVALVQFED